MFCLSFSCACDWHSKEHLYHYLSPSPITYHLSSPPSVLAQQYSIRSAVIDLDPWWNMLGHGAATSKRFGHITTYKSTKLHHVIFVLNPECSIARVVNDCINVTTAQVLTYKTVWCKRYAPRFRLSVLFFRQTVSLKIMKAQKLQTTFSAQQQKRPVALRGKK